MKTYVVRTYAAVTFEFCVEADSKEEAENIIEDNIHLMQGEDDVWVGGLYDGDRPININAIEEGYLEIESVEEA